MAVASAAAHSAPRFWKILGVSVGLTALAGTIHSITRQTKKNMDFNEAMAAGSKPPHSWVEVTEKHDLAC